MATLEEMQNCSCYRVVPLPCWEDRYGLRLWGLTSLHPEVYEAALQTRARHEDRVLRTPEFDKWCEDVRSIGNIRKRKKRTHDSV